jgi:hypothetical protein
VSELSQSPTNGAIAASSTPVAPCPLEKLPVELHQYIHVLENRIAQLESEQVRFRDALLNAGKFVFQNPASKIMLAALPKEAQKKLKDFFDGSN